MLSILGRAAKLCDGISRRAFLQIAAIVVVSMTTRVAWADDAKPVKPVELPPLGQIMEGNRANEPLAKEFSLKKSAEFLDNVAGAWTRQNQCGACHTNFPYLQARPALLDKNTPAPVHDEIRKFFEDRVANHWDKKETRAVVGRVPEVVATAAYLAMNDAQTTGKLHPLTRQALDRMWTLQLKNGGWDWYYRPWSSLSWPPMLDTRSPGGHYYGATLAAVGVASASDHYAQSDQAKAGLEKLRLYFKNNPPPSLHDKAMLFWAAQKLDGLMTQAEKGATIKELFALQNEDGGWSLAGVGNYLIRHDGSAIDRKVSDGYGTGYVIYILRQANIPASDQRIQRGVAWLKTHQRASGRWFTQSVNDYRNHAVTNTGTCYAVLALKACGVDEK